MPSKRKTETVIGNISTGILKKVSYKPSKAKASKTSVTKSARTVKNIRTSKNVSKTNTKSTTKEKKKTTMKKVSKCKCQMHYDWPFIKEKLLTTCYHISNSHYGPNVIQRMKSAGFLKEDSYLCQSCYTYYRKNLDCNQPCVSSGGTNEKKFNTLLAELAAVLEGIGGEEDMPNHDASNFDFNVDLLGRVLVLIGKKLALA